DRRDLAAEWDGRAFSSAAAHVDWNHSTTHFDLNLGYKDIGDGFRADTGFVPQVGYRKHNQNAGWTMRPPSGAVRQVKFFANAERLVDRQGELIARTITPGVNARVLWGGNV